MVLNVAPKTGLGKMMTANTSLIRRIPGGRSTIRWKLSRFSRFLFIAYGFNLYSSH